jgi:CRISPR system Cascade subunit CasC
MSDFIQLHMLVSYPPSNLNRDDLGRPKTAIMGGTQRLRISSQSLKRAWRTSDVFAQGLEGHIGIRTKEMGSKVKESLMSGLPLTQLLEGKNPDLQSATIITEKDAKSWALQIASVFVDKPPKSEGKKTEDSSTDDTEGKKKGTKKEDTKSNINKDTLKGEQLVFYSNNEISAIQSLITTLIKEKREPKSQELSSLLKEDLSSVDVAMFGRMLANATKYNVEAAVQVAHAVTVHEVAVEDDYFTAVDDLNKGEDDAGAAHLGETEFASGLFYTYVCIDKTLLQKNLGGDAVLAKTAVKALVEAATKVAPTGKQNSFASRAYASYLLVEKGSQQPRSLSVAYLGAVRDTKDLLGSAIKSLNETRKKMDDVYGNCCDNEKAFDVHAGTGSLKEILDFCC